MGLKLEGLRFSSARCLVRPSFTNEQKMPKLSLNEIVRGVPDMGNMPFPEKIRMLSPGDEKNA
jgi:hypothetical protein